MEEELNYGSVSSPVKIGDTVHRQAGDWTPTIHALLKFLNEHGFTYAPKVLGIDDDGREILSFLPGKAATRPWPSALFSDGGIKQAAEMLREYHDLVQNFPTPDNAQWRTGKITKKQGQIIRHGDLGPWNTLWQNDKLTGLIDWDFAEPGERITDLAQLSYYFVPLRGEAGWQQAGFAARPNLNERLKMLCIAYGDFKPDEVVDELLKLLSEELHRVCDWGGAGREPWANFLSRGDDKEILADIDWIRKGRRVLGS